MRLFKNKKGIYEYLLTKGVMILFVLALVLIFYNLHENIKGSNAPDVASLEAQRIAKIIDDTITYTDVDTSKIILLKSNLMVGQDLAPHEITIKLGPYKNGLVIVTLTTYPYESIVGVSTFGGNNFEYAKAAAHDVHCCYKPCCGSPPDCDPNEGSKKETVCNWGDIVQGDVIEVSKTKYQDRDGTKYYYITCVEIKGCSGIVYLRNVSTLIIPE